MQGGVKRGVVLRMALKCQLFREIETREGVAFKLWTRESQSGNSDPRMGRCSGSLLETRIM